jgi:hypothetical protein
MGIAYAIFVYTFIFSKLKKAQVSDAHAHVQRLVSVLKMATELQRCITEEQRSVVRFLWEK